MSYVKNGRALLEKGKKYRYPALILALGLLLLLLPTGRRTGAEAAEAAEPQTASRTEADFDLAAFTMETEALLSRLQGAGEVRLLLTLETDGAREYLYDQDRSQGSGDSRSQTQAVVVTRDGDGYPVTVTRRYPTFRGAVVVCSGGDGPGLTLRIKEALSSLTGLGMDQITVLKSA